MFATDVRPTKNKNITRRWEYGRKKKPRRRVCRYFRTGKNDALRLHVCLFFLVLLIGPAREPTATTATTTEIYCERLDVIFSFSFSLILCSLSRRLDFADISPVEYSIAAVRVREPDCIFFSLALEMLISLLDKFGLLLY